MKKCNLKCVLILCIVLLSKVQLSAQCKEEQSALDALQKEYEVLFVDLEKQTEELKKVIPEEPESPSTGIDYIGFDVKFKPQKFSYDLIHVTMRNKSLSLNLPQCSMKRKSFSVPTSKAEWKVKKLCCGIKTKTLVITNGTKQVYFNSPELKMARTEITTKIPEFTKKRQDISLNIPEFKLKSPIPDENKKYDDLEKKSEAVAQQADALSKSGASLEKEQKEKSKVLIINLFTCINNELEKQKIETVKTFDITFNDINNTISQLQANGLDPASVKNDDGSITNLFQVKSDLEKSYKETLDGLNTAIAESKAESEKILVELNTEVS